MEDKGRKTKDLEEVEGKMDTYLTEIYEKQMGVGADFTKWD